MSATERQKLLLQQEIAKLSGENATAHLTPGAISRHGTKPHPSYHPYGYRGRGSRGRGFGSRGRGRGGTLDLRTSRTATAPAEKEDGEVSPQPEAGPSRPTEEWVKKTSHGGNMSLMTVKKR